MLGGGVAALAAALDLAQVGVGVRFAADRRWAPEGEVRDPGGDVAALLGELAAPIAQGGVPEPDAVAVLTPPAQTLLVGASGVLAPQPVPAVWGIPAVPLSSDCIELLGSRGSFRAYLDRLKPVLTIGKEENLAKLVDSRLGKATRELLVEPFVRERFGVAASEAEVSIVAPGLNEGLTRAGSLSGGVLQHVERHVARETVIAPGGGWERLVEILLDRLALYGATPFDATVARIDPDDADGDDAAGWIVTDDTGRQHRFDGIITDPASVSGPLSDTAGDGDQTEIAEAIAALGDGKSRVYAEFGIEAPVLPEFPERPRETHDGDPGELFDLDAVSALRLVSGDGGETWAVRATQHADASWTAELSGPAEAGRGLGSPAEMARMLDAAGLIPLAGEPSVRRGPAPFATHAERDARAAAVRRWELDHPDMLACGETVHGGELGDAIADAREQSVRLRRRLTGIAE